MKKNLILFCSILVLFFACRDDKSKITELGPKCAGGDQEACRGLADIAKNSNDTLVCIKAVESLNDQKLLADIAKNSMRLDVGEIAVKKINDNELLYDIATKAKCLDVRIASVRMMTDQKNIANIAIFGGQEGIRIAAIENPNLTDQTLIGDIMDKNHNPSINDTLVRKSTDLDRLAKIALEDPSKSNTVIWRIIALPSQKNVPLNNKSWRSEVILKYIEAFNSVPENHRTRLREDVFPAIRLLCYPAVISKIGNIISIKAEWYSLGQAYTGSRENYIGHTQKYDTHMNGETFTCKIKVQKLPELISCTWTTNFPGMTTNYSKFIPADINPGDLLKTVLNKLNDQDLYLSIIRSNENYKIQRIAIEKLNDQEVLADIAKKATNEDARACAAGRLTDQNLLSEIINFDKSDLVRQVAIQNPNLKDDKLLADFAKHGDITIRRFAINKLTNKEILSDIAQNDEDYIIKETARNRLRQLKQK